MLSYFGCLQPKWSVKQHQSRCFEKPLSRNHISEEFNLICIHTNIVWFSYFFVNDEIKHLTLCTIHCIIHMKNAKIFANII